MKKLALIATLSVVGIANVKLLMVRLQLMV
jgi:hypothetical protein